MTVTQQLKRSSTSNKRPDPAILLSGELALNYDVATGGVYYTNDTNTLTKIGPAQVSATAPNSSPAGSSGNALGEFWYDTTGKELKIWDGTQWIVTSAAQINVAYGNGGLQIRGLSVQNTATATRVNFNNAQVNYNSAGLFYSNGVFTNVTGHARTYTFDFQLNVSSVRNTGYISPYFTWFQKNNNSTVDLTGTYGLNCYNSGSTQANTVTAQSTTWTFTLEPGDTISCWASFDTAAVLTYAGSTSFTAANSGTRVNVAEIVTTETGYQSGGWAEYRGAAATASGNNSLDWNTPVAAASDFTLTYNPANRSFVNTSTQTRTYRFDAVVGGAIPGTTSYNEWYAWFGKNNGGSAAATNRYSQIFQPKVTVPGANAQATAVKTISWVFELAPGDLITTFWYSDVSFPINGSVYTPAGTIPSAQVCKLRITEIQAVQSPQAGGVWLDTLEGPTTITALNTRINWSADIVTIDTLNYDTGLFTFVGTQPRTFLISIQVLFNGPDPQSYVSTWLQYNAATLSTTARYSYNLGYTDNSTSTVQSFSQILTLQPGDTFSTWFNCFPTLSSGNSIGGSGLGMDGGASTRLSIVDITAVTDGEYGTISGVTAGVGLSGGGTTGVVTVALDPATSSELGGVKQGSGFSIASDGSISSVAGGSNTQVQYLDGSTVTGEAAFTFNTLNNTLTVPAFDGTTFDCGSF